MSELIATIVHRPYVFAFLAAFLFLAWRLLGWRRTVLWLVFGYLIAWASEYSSIHNGFPYGEYHYVYENMQGELMIAGVPFFDSLSYSFLTFAGYAMAAFALGRERASGILAALLGALLTMLLDVIIDPIATMGELWFLGNIHYYAHPGFYFGVPLTNFGGWFLVSFAIIGLNLSTWKGFPRLFESRVPGPGSRSSWLYPAFYAGIAAFSIFMSFWIGRWRLVLASSAILGIVMAAACLRRRSDA
ncbi:MAG: carotenoid biosynthesis protein [Proteobacteria bacterium]|nr:carotenoid biosynthesis protein [Pseudomonadota bacterium]